ncbi:MAG: archaemetzincin family Zn-dependent metalloprotease [Bacteroidetes bacterium]|nr:archaemetzincin family Zn-dependent metalloprotease [Bacteroidota bacterium]
MNQQHITLISFGYFRKDILEVIAREVKLQYALPVIFREGHLDLTEFYDSSRRQYNGNRLLKQVDTEFASDASKTLGLFSVDLFIPILTYIFGQAAFNGRAGIASLYRLSNERYGIEPDDNLLLERFTKEVIHELGHTFGLMHCTNTSCVMHSSTYVEDIDQKEQQLCPKCREELEKPEMAK